MSHSPHHLREEARCQETDGIRGVSAKFHYTDRARTGPGSADLSETDPGLRQSLVGARIVEFGLNATRLSCTLHNF